MTTETCSLGTERLKRSLCNVLSPEDCPDDAVRSDVEVVARRASERLAVLRAFELSKSWPQRLADRPADPAQPGEQGPR